MTVLLISRDRRRITRFSVSAVIAVALASPVILLATSIQGLLDSTALEDFPETDPNAPVLC